MSYVYYKNPSNQEVYGYDDETQQELIQQAIDNEWIDVTGSWPLPYVPTAAENKATAANILSQTDWTTIADVGNPQMSNPYLANQAEFIAYRNAVRQYAVYPVAGDVDWPVVPQENWVKV